MKNTKLGFSLIEILVVMVIIGVILSFVILAFGDFGNSRRIMMQQQHLGDLIKLARIRAIIESKTYGLHLTNKNYTFYQFYHAPSSPYGHWLQLKNNTFKSKTFPSNVKIKYNHPLSKNTPEIIISPDGHITPFTLHLITSNQDQIKLNVKFNGAVNLKEVTAR